MTAQIVSINNYTDISDEVMREDGKLKLMAAYHWQQYKWEDFRLFCHFKGRYGIPTSEQINFLKAIIGNRKAIEIGAGAGDLGFHLGIHMTDSRQQERPEIKKLYEAMQQPLISYPADVEKKEALDAVYKYAPQVVVASWVTTYAPHKMPYGSNPFGIKEDVLLDKVETYILIGNTDIHGDKPIMQKPHKEIYDHWLVSRAANQKNNRIWIWNSSSIG